MPEMGWGGTGEWWVTGRRMGEGIEVREGVLLRKGKRVGKVVEEGRCEDYEGEEHYRLEGKGSKAAISGGADVNP